jgi:hypothetical protein
MGMGEVTTKGMDMGAPWPADRRRIGQ